MSQPQRPLSRPLSRPSRSNKRKSTPRKTTSDEKASTGPSNSLADLTLLHSGNFADAVIVSNGQEWKVHRSIVCPRSGYFDAAFNGNFEEGASYRVTLDETEPHQIDKLLRYIYGGDIQDVATSLGNNSIFTTCAELWALGAYFQVQPMLDDSMAALGKLCDDKLREMCTYEPFTEANMENHVRCSDPPKNARLEYLAEMHEAIRVAYASSPAVSTPVQTTLAAFVWASREQMLARPEPRLVYDGLMDEIPAFGRDIAKAMLGTSKSPWLPQVCQQDVALVDRAGFVSVSHYRKKDVDCCGRCQKMIKTQNPRGIYNPFSAVARPKESWCKACVTEHGMPWRAAN